MSSFATGGLTFSVEDFSGTFLDESTGSVEAVDAEREGRSVAEAVG